MLIKATKAQQCWNYRNWKNTAFLYLTSAATCKWLALSCLVYTGAFPIPSHSSKKISQKKANLPSAPTRRCFCQRSACFYVWSNSYSRFAVHPLNSKTTASKTDEQAFLLSRATLNAIESQNSAHSWLTVLTKSFMTIELQNVQETIRKEFFRFQKPLSVKTGRFSTVSSTYTAQSSGRIYLIQSIFRSCR